MFSSTIRINALIWGILGLFCLILMVGCAVQSEVVDNPSLTVMASPVLSVSPEGMGTEGPATPETGSPVALTVSSTLTLSTSPTRTRTEESVATETEALVMPTPTAEPLREFETLAICIPVESKVPQAFELSGGLFLYDPTRGRQSNAVLMDLPSGSIGEFAPTDYRVIMLRISPDGTQVAYIVINRNDYSDRRLVVRNFATNATIDLPWKPEWDLSGLRQWLNDQEILIRLQSYEYPYPLIAFNPFTQQSADLPIIFPNRGVLPPGSGVSPTEYDPSLNYVVYSANQDGGYGFSLFDRSANVQVAFFPAENIVESGSPAWSHDGMKFVFASKMGADLFINLGRPDGSTTSIVKLSGESGPFDMRGMTWSPNDQFVVVNIYNIQQGTDKLLLLDLDGQKVWDPCMQIDYDPWLGGYSDSNFPTWSPDSRYLIVEEQFDDGKNKVILIDVTQMRAGILAQDQMVLGWVVPAP